MDQEIKTPSISVILASYNGQKYLAEAIESVLKQSYKNLELIIVDDGSVDHTFLIARKYQHADARIQIFQQKNKGPGIARNYGITKAKSSYIALIDDDDFWIDENKLQKQITFLEDNPHHVLVGGGKSLPQSDEVIRNSILEENCFITSSVIFKKEAFLKAGQFKNMRLAEDYDLWLRMGLFGLMANIDCLIGHRERMASISFQRKLDMYKTMLKTMRRQHKKYPRYWRGLLKSYTRIIFYKIFN